MNKLFSFLIVLVVIGCKDRYDIPLKNTDQSLLVVEGVLAAGQDSTIITLSKTLAVNDKSNFKPVLLAHVTVEDKNGTIIPLKENGNGKYVSSQLGLVIGAEYRLHVKTNDNKEYASDYVVAKQTPAIDSITWKKENGDMFIYANTHDPNNNTKYYKWDYDETWEIHSHYAAGYEWVGGTTIIPSLLHNYRCWKYGSSNTINIGSSVHLSSDVISELPVQVIPKGSEKLSVRYSMLLRQQSLTKEAYAYFELMKKNTESVGSIFDPLPSELRGNIHCLSNSNESVIGYITSSSFSKKRIFITNQQANWVFTEDCSEIYRIKNNPDSIKQWVPGFLPWGAEMDMTTGRPIYYFMSNAFCVDCTQRGGNLGMPSYW